MMSVEGKENYAKSRLKRQKNVAQHLIKHEWECEVSGSSGRHKEGLETFIKIFTKELILFHYYKICFSFLLLLSLSLLVPARQPTRCCDTRQFTPHYTYIHCCVSNQKEKVSLVLLLRKTRVIEARKKH